MNDTLWYIVINVPNNLLINHISFLNSQKYEFSIDDNNREISIVIPNIKIKGELILEKYKGGLSEEFIKETDAKFEIYKLMTDISIWYIIYYGIKFLVVKNLI